MTDVQSLLWCSSKESQQDGTEELWQMFSTNIAKSYSNVVEHLHLIRI